MEGSLGLRIWDTPEAEVPGVRCVMGVQGDPPGWRYSGNPWAEAWEESIGRFLKLGVLGVGWGYGGIPWGIQP